jgi:hypothetical protein
MPTENIFCINFVFHFFFLSYASDSSGNASGSLRVLYGYGVLETLGRLLVLHDASGARISCQVIGNKPGKCCFFLVRKCIDF